MAKSIVIKGVAGSVRVVRNAEWQEWIAKPINGRGEDSWYHTSDKQDALQTAQTMANQDNYFMKSNPKKRASKPRSAAQRAAIKKLVAFNKARRLKKNPTRKIAKRKREPRAKTWVHSNKQIRRIVHNSVKRAPVGQYKVQVYRGNKWVTLGAFMQKDIAKDYGNSLAAKYRRKEFRLYW